MLPCAESSQTRPARVHSDAYALHSSPVHTTRLSKQALIQKREGEYRHVTQRLVAHAEEVAFYGGVRRERAIIQRAFTRLLGKCIMWISDVE